jgi:Rps23 Pro-64 3,4-dihydroxylase Tpa1-like proline 4-hydroxylase
MIPHVLMPGALPPALCERLLAYALDEQDRRCPGRVGRGASSYVDRESRDVSTIRASSELHATLAGMVDGWLPGVRASLGLPPAVRGDVQVSIVAYGDGGHYARHVDVFTGADAGSTPREVTFVGYFFREPRRFTGGALRLFDIFGDDQVDIEPSCGLVAAFPAWLPHQVLPVACPDGGFADSRFAVNIWVLRKPRGN